MPYKDKEKARANNREHMRKRRAANPQVAAYLTQKSHAKARGIQFLLTFEEWWNIWLQSGEWEQRGKRVGQYVMARTGDVGPYAVGNVRICTNAENMCEYAEHISKETRKRMSESGHGRKHSKEALENMSEAQLKAWLIRDRAVSSDARLAMSIAQKARWEKVRQGLLPPRKGALTHRPPDEHARRLMSEAAKKRHRGSRGRFLTKL